MPAASDNPSGRSIPTPPRGAELVEFDRLFDLFYQELRAIARRHLRHERAGHTLQTTALVHEAYVKLSGRTGVSWAEPANFRAYVSKAMRHVLIDHARSRASDKRSGGAVHVRLEPGLALSEDQVSVHLLDVDRALTKLAQHDTRLVQVVECRFFGGLTANETAQTLDVSLSTVERDWLRARAYLRQILSAVPPSDALAP